MLSCPYLETHQLCQLRRYRSFAEMRHENLLTGPSPGDHTVMEILQLTCSQQPINNPCRL
ncbi:hypothetical protein BC938DRAFT_477011 [Jimgerdemannia flammicorona]|uniref:Uncharacterized protein n=1 Tax=Jimgerdemannia flammicorona TaxID=994334 RepID=A0A433QPX1_9FUNG|nr:hypothetical protein BC938DRAFT_477011 [Jimgerdemannia flammicorona]